MTFDLVAYATPQTPAPRAKPRHWCAGLLITLLTMTTGARAASVDLYIDNRSDKGSYAADEVQVHTVVVGNRGPGAASNTAFTLDVPNTAQSGQNWASTVSCVATGGAVCPAGYSLSNLTSSTLTGSIPMLPSGSALTLTVHAPGNPGSGYVGPLNVVASVTAGPGDTDLSGNTNTSNAWIYIPAPVSSYGTSVAGPASVAAPGSTAVPYTVVVRNQGDTTNSIATALAVALGQGTGTASSLPYLAATRFVSIVCTGSTGGASCSNVFATTSGLQLQNPQPASLADGTANPQYVGALGMPPGSTVTLSVTLDTGITQCSDSPGGNGHNRSLTLRSSLVALSDYGGIDESVGNPADDSDLQTTTVGTFACHTGDLQVNSIVQSPAVAPIGPNAPFSYTVTYSNSVASPDAATNVPLNFYAVWPTGGVVMQATASCVASGGAVCPAAYTVANGSAVTAIAPSMPTNSQLQITFSGTSGGNSTQLCQPQVLRAQATIRPGADYSDTNFNPAANPSFVTGTPTQGNNAYQTQTQANIGVPCGLSYDLSTEKSGPFSDYAATVPITVVAPGQFIYFRHKVKLLAPSDPLVDYTIRDDLSYYLNPARTGGSGMAPAPSGVQFDGSGSFASRIFFTGNPADPPGLSTPLNLSIADSLVTPYNTGVRCTASGGAVCPDSIVGGSSSGGGGGFFYSSGWTANWSTGKPVFPVNGELEFVATYRVPPIRSVSPTCANGPVRSYPRNTIRATGRPDPLGADRNTANDIASVDFDMVAIPNCVGSLTVQKTALDTTMPADGVGRYQIVLTNSGTSVLDMPNLRDWLTPHGSATMACTATTGGAACPGFTPLQGTKYRDNGATTSPLTMADAVFNSETDTIDFDFSWGTPGSATMPVGSSVTFLVTVRYPDSVTSAYNTAIARADAANPIPFSTVISGAGIDPSPGAALAVSKVVTPQAAQAGTVVTYTVSLRNASTSPASNVLFRDAMPAGFASANPAGYGNLSCRALTAGDGILAPSPAPVAVACPAFTNTSAGLTATIASLPANSGLRISYTAVVPPGFQTVPNVAELRSSGSVRSDGDATSQANVAIQAAPSGPPPESIPTLNEWALLLLSALAALLGVRRLGSTR